MSNLEDMTLYELKELAKENNIKNISRLKKEEIIEKLLKLENESNLNDAINKDILHIS